MATSRVSRDLPGSADTTRLLTSATTASPARREEIIHRVIRQHLPRARSLDADPEGARSLIDRLGQDEHGYGECEARIVVRDALRALGSRDRQIVELRFFHGLTQEQIGSMIGVSQMQVSRLLSRIFRDLRTRLGADAA